MNPSTKKLTVAVLIIFAIAMAASIQNLHLIAAPQAKEGVELYKSKCAMCHGADGSGNTAMGKKQGVRDLRSPEVQKQADAQLTELIGKGKGKMPAYAEKIKPEEVKQLVACIRALKK